MSKSYMTHIDEAQLAREKAERGHPYLPCNIYAALPQEAKDYIMLLETRCDPAGDVAELANRRDQVKQLEALVKRLKREAEGYQDVVYTCGCEASGHNVASYCPIHGVTCRPKKHHSKRCATLNCPNEARHNRMEPVGETGGFALVTWCDDCVPEGLGATDSKTNRSPRHHGTRRESVRCHYCGVGPREACSVTCSHPSLPWSA